MKSCVIGSNMVMQEQLRQRPSVLALPVAQAFKDLGVAQGLGVEGRVIEQNRWAAAIQRMKRIGGLAVDLSGRGKFLANNAMAAGTFGAGVAPTTATTAVWLKRWAMHAVWRGGHNALPNLLFSAQ